MSTVSNAELLKKLEEKDMEIANLKKEIANLKKKLVVRIAAIISVYAGWNWVYAEAVSQTGKFSI